MFIAFVKNYETSAVFKRVKEDGFRTVSRMLSQFLSSGQVSAAAYAMINAINLLLAFDTLFAHGLTVLGRSYDMTGLKLFAFG